MLTPFARRLIKLAAGSAIALGCAGMSLAAVGEWPQWRGPNRDNLSKETGLLKDWPEGGPALAWKATGLGAGYSSLSVAGGKIFTMGSFPNNPSAPPPEVKLDKNGKKIRPPVDETTAVLAFDLNGKPLWATKVGPTGGGGGYVGPRSTPTIDGDFLYALSDNGDLVCLQVSDGTKVWSHNFTKEYNGKMMSGWGYSESVTIEGDLLLCCPGGKDGTVAAFDKKTGSPLWRSKDFTDASSYASLVPCEIGGVHQYVVLTNASVAGIGKDGALLWKADREGKTAVIATPVIHDDMVFVTSSYGVGADCFKVTKDGDKFKTEQLYKQIKDMMIHHGGVVQLDGVIYGATDNKGLEAISMKDGAVLWKERSITKGSIAYSDGHLYTRAEGSGNVALVELSKEGYKEHGMLHQPDRSSKAAWAHPVIAGGRLYLRDQDILLCYDIKAK